MSGLIVLLSLVALVYSIVASRRAIQMFNEWRVMLEAFKPHLPAPPSAPPPNAPRDCGCNCHQVSPATLRHWRN